MYEPHVRLPYIPPPDYSPAIRPVGGPKATVQAGDRYLRHSYTEPQRLPVIKDDHGKPHNYVPEVREKRSRSSRRPPEEERAEEPRDQSPDQVQRRVNRMLREQGVPVLPFAQPKDVQGPHGPTKAYMRHLENHRKYDTLKSFRSCDNCELCKQMQAEVELVEEEQRRERSRVRSQPARPPSYPARDIINGRIYENPFYHDLDRIEPVRFVDKAIKELKIFGDSPEKPRPQQLKKNNRLSVDVRQIGQVPQLPSTKPVYEQTARVRKDVRAHVPQQLSVQKGEYVKVSGYDRVWALCTNRQGKRGWVPTCELNFAANSAGSSPMSS